MDGCTGSAGVADNFTRSGNSGNLGDRGPQRLPTGPGGQPHPANHYAGSGATHSGSVVGAFDPPAGSVLIAITDSPGLVSAV